MKNSDMISVIVPVYNCEKYLHKCLNSILEQTYSNLEIILIDDGSSDQSGKICEDYAKFDCRIKVFHQKNQGVSSSRNLGIHKASGTYITFVDSDDFIDASYIEELLSTLLKHNATYITCGYKRIYSEHIERINDDGKEMEVTSEDFIKKLLNVQNGYGFVHTKLIKKNAIHNIQFEESLKVGEDALFNIQLCSNIKKVVIYHKALYNYRYNADSAVRKYDKDYVKKYLKSMQCMKQYINFKYKKNIKFSLDLNNYIAYHVLLICVNYCYHSDNPSFGLKSLKEVCNIPLFKYAIKNSDYENLSLTRKISLFTLKHRWYFIMEIICKIRQKQLR